MTESVGLLYTGSALSIAIHLKDNDDEEENGEDDEDDADINDEDDGQK